MRYRDSILKTLRYLAIAVGVVVCLLVALLVLKFLSVAIGIEATE
jgi:hypothetical protein